MSKSPKLVLLLGLCAGALGGCTATHPVNYRGLASASQMAPNPQDKDGHVPFRYSATDIDWASYTSVVLDPVPIYDGSDQQFGDMSAADRKTLADYMQAQFGEALKGKYALVNAPGPNTLRIHATLTGAEASTPVISTVSKIAPVGLVVNSVQSVRDKEASFSGSVSYAVEIYDSTSGRLLRAYVSKQYPFAENVAASFGTLDASRAGIRNGSDDLLAQLR